MTFNGQDNTTLIVIKGCGEVRTGQASLHKTQLLKNIQYCWTENITVRLKGIREYM